MNSHLIAILVFAIALACTDAYALPATDQKDAAYVGATVYDGTGTAGRPDMVIVSGRPYHSHTSGLQLSGPDKVLKSPAFTGKF